MKDKKLTNLKTIMRIAQFVITVPDKLSTWFLSFFFNFNEKKGSTSVIYHSIYKKIASSINIFTKNILEGKISVKSNGVSLAPLNPKLEAVLFSFLILFLFIKFDYVEFQIKNIINLASFYIFDFLIPLIGPVESFFPEILNSIWIFFLFFSFILKYDTIKNNNSYFLWYIIKKNFTIYFLFLVFISILFLVMYKLNVGFYYKGFVNDYFVYFSKFFVVFLIILATGSCYFYYQNFNKTYIFEIPMIFSFLSFFLMFLVSSFDFLSIFFCTEGVTFTLVTALIYNYNYEDSTFSAVKYLVLASVSAGLFGFGCAFLYALTNSTNFYFIKKILEFGKDSILLDLSSKQNYFFSAGLIFLIFGFFFKLAAAPMHQWSIDIYSSANWGIIFLFATAIKVAFFAIFFRWIYYIFLEFSFSAYSSISFSSLLSLFIGSLGSIAAANLKEFVAYSSLSQLGFTTVSMLPFSLIAIATSSFFFFYYVVSMCCFFLVIIFFTTDSENFFFNFFSSKNSFENKGEISGADASASVQFKKNRILNLFSNNAVKYMDSFFLKDFFILSFNSLINFSKRPLAAFCLSVSLINLAGLPPFPGFFSKFFILISLFKENFFLYGALILIFSLISAFYYLRLLMLIWIDFLGTKSYSLTVKNYFDKVHPAWPRGDEFYYEFFFLKKNRLLSFFLSIITIFLIFSIFYVSDVWVIGAVILSKGVFYVSKIFFISFTDMISILLNMTTKMMTNTIINFNFIELKLHDFIISPMAADIFQKVQVQVTISNLTLLCGFITMVALFSNKIVLKKLNKYIFKRMDRIVGAAFERRDNLYNIAEEVSNQIENTTSGETVDTPVTQAISDAGGSSSGGGSDDDRNRRNRRKKKRNRKKKVSRRGRSNNSRAAPEKKPVAVVAKKKKKASNNSNNSNNSFFSEIKQDIMITLVKALTIATFKFIWFKFFPNSFSNNDTPNSSSSNNNSQQNNNSSGQGPRA